MADLIDVELFPSMRCPALTLTANLKTEQALDVTSNPVVVRLDDSGASGSIDELDEMLVADCAHEFVIHGLSISQNERRSTRLKIALSFTVASLVSCCAFWA